MNLKRFTIITHNEAQQVDEKTTILINLEHIVSVKPIKMATANRDIIDGHWIRLSNGKKYRAIQVPEIITNALKDTLPAIKKSSDDAGVSLSYQ